MSDISTEMYTIGVIVVLVAGYLVHKYMQRKSGGGSASGETGAGRSKKRRH